ncbi:MAG: FUSC family protein [Hyphomicrobium sp.]|nr:FUSC family protein [Hyphomicrobium sp.]
MIDLTPWTGPRAEMWPRLRLAIQTTIAACLAYVIVDALGMPQGFWAVMTAILVTQANVGASLGLAAERLGGSLLGVLVGGAVAVALADAQELKFAGLAVTVLILGFFSAHRPSLRIACVTAAIVVLGDPSVGPPIASAENRMIEVVVGTVVAILTSLIVFPSRAGPAFAAHVTRTFAPLFEVARDTLSAAMGQPLDIEAMGAQGTRIRAAFAAGDTLAREARLEVAGYLADSPDPEAILRALRRLWHTEIMLMRAVAEPLPEKAVQILGPQIEALRAAIDDVAKQLASPATAYAAPNLSEVESALAAIEHRMEEMRARGETRDLSMDDIIRLMAFDFALGQLRLNLRDIAERTTELAAFAGSTFPFLRRLHAMLRGLRR